MNKTRRSRRESGAVLIHVALALLVLLGVSALAVDYGVMWASRTQAQAAADAGALAGAVTLAYGPPAADPRSLADPVNATARDAAAAVARANRVWGEAPGVLVDRAGTALGSAFPCPADATARICDGMVGCIDQCVQVDAYRNQADRQPYAVEGNQPLPTLFARVLRGADGRQIVNQGVRATATAAILSGSLVPRCVKPFALPDRWMEGGTRPSVFGDVFDSPPDVYDDTLARWKWPDDYGEPVILYVADGLTSSWAQLVSVGGAGGEDVADAIAGCIPVSAKVNPDWDEVILNKPGMTVGNIRKGVDDLKEAYPNTLWNHAERRLECGDPSGCDNPRLGAIPIFNPELAASGRETVPIIDLIGIYIEGRGSDDEVRLHHPEVAALKKSDWPKIVVGHIVPYAALRDGGGGPPRPSSFARTVVLIR